VHHRSGVGGKKIAGVVVRKINIPIFAFQTLKQRLVFISVVIITRVNDEDVDFVALVNVKIY
jgi:hypothetical protein